MPDNQAYIKETKILLDVGNSYYLTILDLGIICVVQAYEVN